MYKRTGLLAVTIGLSLSPWVARADGCFMPDAKTFREMRERLTISEPEQKAAIIFRGGTEDLIISPRFSGSATRFAWVIPVPARPRVRTLDGALFHELAAITYVPEGKGARDRAAPGALAGGAVQVLERKAVGAYDVAVLKAGDAGALMRWLKANGFVMPSAAQGPIQEHVKEKWTFVAARVRVPRAAQGLREGTLAPIRLTFRTRKPIYPMRVSRANPADFTVELYYIVPVRKAYARGISHALVQGPGSPPSDRARVAGYYRAGESGTPTLASLLQDTDAAIMVTHRYVRPEMCTRDMTWEVPAWAARRAAAGPRPRAHRGG